MTTLLIATRNRHKVGEIQEILGGGFQCLTLADFPGAPAVVEDADTFAGNAAKKAEELARWLALHPDDGRRRAVGFVLADDSGLEVDALGGAPGVHSARFAAMDMGVEGNSPDADNNAKLLHLLRDVPAERRTARFRCAIALTPVPEPVIHAASPVCLLEEVSMRTRIFDGACEGRMQLHPTGVQGFGYDPLFIPDGFQQSFAELGAEVKHRLSHRARALAKLQNWLAAAGRGMGS
jgi:XTP/dITP diphosphohydrolase